jgi:hypothetical protein
MRVFPSFLTFDQVSFNSGPAAGIRLPRRVHNQFVTTNQHGWISYGEGDNSHLTVKQRQMVEERSRERQEQRGGLLGVVVVSVYEHGCHPQVNFPDGALLGVETDASVISEVVARASAELANWH